METDDLYRILRTGHVQAQGIVDTIGNPLLVLDENLRVQAASRSFFETFRVDSDETIGKLLYDLGNGQWDIPELRRLLEEVIPKATAVLNYEVEHEFPSIGRKTMLMTARVLRGAPASLPTMLLAIVDVTDQHDRDHAKDLLFGELRHRMKNVFGVMQSLARQTTTKGRTAEEYRDAFLGRLQALIKAEDLAFDEQQETGLREVLERLFAAYMADPPAVLIEPGPALALKPRTIMSMSVVLHELGTNAAKYGALSAPGGAVRIRWMVEEGGRQLRLQWEETGGPAVSAPAQTGYGTTLIESTTTYNLRGTLELDYRSSGLRAEMVIPLGSAPAKRAAPVDRGAHAEDDPGRRG